MESKYGNIQQNTLFPNSTDLINQIFKLLPYKEKSRKESWISLTTILFRINGMAQLFQQSQDGLLLWFYWNQQNWKTLKYIKAILDCCLIVKTILGDADAWII